MLIFAETTLSVSHLGIVSVTLALLVLPEGQIHWELDAAKALAVKIVEVLCLLEHEPYTGLPLLARNLGSNIV